MDRSIRKKRRDLEDRLYLVVVSLDVPTTSLTGKESLEFLNCEVKERTITAETTMNSKCDLKLSR